MKNSTLRSPKKLAAKPPIADIAKFGVSILCVFFGFFFFWSLFAPIESAAIAPGKITVDSNRKTIQHLEGGIVKQLNVKEGKVVKRGEALIVLDDTQARASLQLLKGQAIELLAQEARLKAERDNLKKILFPTRVETLRKQAKVKKIILSQESIFKANRTTLKGRVGILKQRVTQLEKEIDSLQAQVSAQAKQLKLIQEEIKAVEYLEKKKLIEKPRLLALQREAARLLGDQGEHLGVIAKTQQRIGETQSQILSVYDDYKREVLTELREAQQKLADILEREKAAQDVLDRTAIKAPQDGRVVGLVEHTVGGVIAPGEEVMHIVPSRDELVVEARVDPLDIDVIHEGLIAKVQLTAYKQRNTPALEGKVIHISADSFDEQQSGQSFYSVRISIPTTEREKIKNLRLHPGMPVQVMIITDKRSPFAYFVGPIKDSFHRAFREQ